MWDVNLTGVTVSLEDERLWETGYVTPEANMQVQKSSTEGEMCQCSLLPAQPRLISTTERFAQLKHGGLQQPYTKSWDKDWIPVVLKMQSHMSMHRFH